MRMHNRQFSGIVFLFLVALFTMSCSEKKEAVKAPVVSKKIASTVNAGDSQPSVTTNVPDTTEKKDEKASAADTAAGSPRIYDPSKRINPFTPLFGMKETQSASVEGDKKRKKRIPQTPLERISLDQLKLVAIVRASTGNRALVEDNIGKGYIIKNGTYIGLNSGMVIQINPDSVMIEEEIENLKGELVLQRTEIKLQKPAGE